MGFFDLECRLPPLRVVFMGTPEFAVPTLLEISNSSRVPVAVYTRAPARGGRRGLEMTRTPVHSVADSLKIPVFTPASLRDVEAQKVFKSLAPDVAVVAAYGLILPIPILEAPRFGCLNLHASLLPRWRGAAPIQRAIMAGDSQTGIDVMRMDAGLDTGPIAMREIVPIHPDETAADLTSRLAAVAAKLSVRALHSMAAGLLEFHEQPPEGVCYAHKIKKSEADVDWTQNAETVRNQIHGLSATPGAFSIAGIGSREENIKFYRAEVAAGTGSPGTILSEDMRVACGVGAIRVLEGQRSGKTVMSGRELMRGGKLAPGALFRRSHTPLSGPQA
ncbi:MAG TPA: methionyl-tRNA formyltransferase [Xanthobacteraceae bacterium]|nr:methionyl-tRNA formyltransferase [Xanthobacteraceae bacterium]